MNATTLRRIAANKFFIAVAVFYALLTIGNFTVSLRAGLIWTGVLVAALVIVGAIIHGGYRQQDKFRAEMAEIAADRERRLHEHDIQLERLAQEADLVAAGGPVADQIVARWDAERRERQAREREERQARIAAYEADRLDA